MSTNIGRQFFCLSSTAYYDMQRLTLWGKLMLPRLPSVCIAAGSGRCFFCPPNPYKLLLIMETNNNLGVLLPINENNGKRAVNARDLHSFLESKQDFSTWMKNRIDQYGFIENQDYQILAPQNYGASWGGSNKVEYALSIGMAKELSMVERTDKGRQARKYFIACEEAVNHGTLPSKHKPLSLSDQMKAATWAAKFLNLNESSKLLMAKKILDPLGLPTPDYTPSKGVLKSASELLKERGLQISSREFNTRAIEKGFLCEMERKSKHGAKKFFKSITKKGLSFGENQVSPHNPNSTQPHWYVEKFDELLGLVGIQMTGGLLNGN